MNAKSQLRKRISSILASLGEQEKRQQSEQVFKQIIAHPKYKQASRVSIYLSTNNEIDTQPILRRALEVDKKRCYVPLVLKRSIQGADRIESATRMVMYELRSMAEYEQLPLNHYGIKEPRGIEDHASRLASSLDLVLTPGVAFDRAGNRLGHGKGYYDEFFGKWSADPFYTIGVAFREQIVGEGELPLDEGRDICLDEVLTAAAQ